MPPVETVATAIHAAVAKHTGHTGISLLCEMERCICFNDSLRSCEHAQESMPNPGSHPSCDLPE